MNDYQIQYNRMLLARKLCLIPLLAAVILYVLSIYMNAHYDMWMIRHIRDFSFGNLFINVAGFIYLLLFTKDLKVSYDLCRYEPSNFKANVKYATFGIVLIAISFFISVVWIVTMLVLTKGL